jgi:hypothetical protein
MMALRGCEPNVNRLEFDHRNRLYINTLYESFRVHIGRDIGGDGHMRPEKWNFFIRKERRNSLGDQLVQGSLDWASLRRA